MAQQMNTILLLLIFIGLAGVLLTVFFTLEKVNDIATGKNKVKPRFNAAETFGGLSGKDLWDAMLGVPMRGITPKEILSLKPRYEVVLQKHLEILFEEGQRDAREGFAMPVRCERVVPTLRGEIESWLPHEYASGIYKIGYSLITEPDEDEDKLREQLDEIGDEIFYAAGLPPHPLSRLLLPYKEEEELSPEEPEHFPEEPKADSNMAEVPDDAQAPVASLQAPGTGAEADAALASTMSAEESASAAESAAYGKADSATTEPVAVEGDTLPVKQAQAEAVPAA